MFGADGADLGSIDPHLLGYIGSLLIYLGACSVEQALFLISAYKCRSQDGPGDAAMPRDAVRAPDA
ncbi:MAG: hypothetical protein RIF37_00510 [Rhodospirillaceae bacterium]